IVLTIGGSQGLTAQQIFVQTLLSFAEIEKLNFPAIFAHRVIDQLNDLIVANPAVRMKNQIEHALLDHGGIERRFPIRHRDWISRCMEMKRLPIAWGHRWKFPTEFADDVGIGIIRYRGRKRWSRPILFKTGAALALADQLARKGCIIRRAEVHHRR